MKNRQGGKGARGHEEQINSTDTVRELSMDVLTEARSGLPIRAVKILDAHGHMGPYFNFHIAWNDAAGMVEAMDRLGVRTTCVCPHAAIGPDIGLGNDMVMDAIDRYPGRFIGYIGTNPNYLEEVAPEALTGGDPDVNARLFEAVLDDGEAALPATRHVLLNAAAGLRVAGRARTLAEGYRRASESHGAGATREAFDAYRGATRRLAEDA